MHITVHGPARFNNNSPGNTQTNQEVPPATPTPPPTPPTAPEPVKVSGWKKVERAAWVATIAAAIFGGILLFPSKSAPPPSIAPAPVPPVTPTVPIAPPPSAPAPRSAEPMRAAPEQPKIPQPVKHARKPPKKTDAEPKTTSTTPAPPREEPKPTPAPSPPAPAAPVPAPVVAAAVPAPPPPKPAPPPPPAKVEPPPAPDPLLAKYLESERFTSPAECPKLLKKCEDWYGQHVGGDQHMECLSNYANCKYDTAHGRSRFKPESQDRRSGSSPRSR